MPTIPATAQKTTPTPTKVPIAPKTTGIKTLDAFTVMLRNASACPC